MPEWLKSYGGGRINPSMIASARKLRDGSIGVTLSSGISLRLTREDGERFWTEIGGDDASDGADANDEVRG